MTVVLATTLMLFLFTVCKARGRSRVSYFAIAFVTLTFLIIMIAVTVKPITRYQTHRAATMYYGHLAAGEFEKAFEYVAYYDRYSDLKPEVPYEDAKQIWVNRVSKMKENGIYLSKVEKIKVFIDDGYPMGTAYVIIVNKGIENSATQHIHFVNFGGWKVQSVRSTSGGLPEFDKTISGYIPGN